ncbi:UDP-N-acetylglucosamine pyrophosphorylase [Acidaminobacter sp. JC074]|uniref:UDP-N-acetylglucosamine pyrophosphorylase n=1 Tax=Acidaminobacter sp. JC074 TaxID=2530199 RepID=UPI001F0FC9A7|nr:UDP-N-acetylglucosamine pyrophosphorylase [Acidaminobacter sp. JC074]MCH4886278.1 UDP-N-acetylglucosamine pyrophosphorylase [Acidaminobacter sp. JC074]
MDLKIKNLLDLKETISAGLFDGLEYPWQAIPKISDYITELGMALSLDDYDKVSEYVWISKTAKVTPTAFIEGPTIIDHDAEIRHCAFIRGGVIVGKSSIVGNSSELKNAILFNEVQVPHFNYVGDSILGYKSHMGAGSITSNMKSDKSNVSVKSQGLTIETGLRKFGTILGDYVEVGSNAVLNPGSVVGRNSNIYPLSMVRGAIPQNSIYKKYGDLVEKV